MTYSSFAACSLLDLEIVFVAYGDSNIRGENTLGTSHEPTVQQCMDRCLLNGACLTFDYRGRYPSLEMTATRVDEQTNKQMNVGKQIVLSDRVED